MPLSVSDRHFFTSIRSLLTNEQSEFDSQILALAKIVIDSLNTEELRKATEDIPLNQAKKEYRDAGGNKKSILALSYSGLGKIRAETILLQNKNEK